MPLVFVSPVEAWDSQREIVTFVGEDAGTRAAIVCAVTAQALVTHFQAPSRNVAAMVMVFRQNRSVIEQIASAAYDANGRHGPVVLRNQDFNGRINPPPTH